MYGDEGAWNALMAKIVRAQVDYLNAPGRGRLPGAAGVRQLGRRALARRLPPLRRAAHRAPDRGLVPGVPVIHFGTGTATLLADMKAAGGDVIGLDWRVELGAAWDALGRRRRHGQPRSADAPGPPKLLEREARRCSTRPRAARATSSTSGMASCRGTPVDPVVRLVDFVHEASARA